MWKKTREQVASLLESCITNRSLKSGKLLHAYIYRTALSSHTYLSNRLIDFYSKCNHLKYAHQVFDEMSQRDVFTWNAMLSGFCSSNQWEHAYVLFDEMPQRNVVSWNNMISGCVTQGEYAKALELYVLMVSDGFLPTHFTLASVFGACGALFDIEFGRVCHGVGVKVGVDENVYVGNGLISFYTKCKCLDDAIVVFREMGEPNAVSFTALIGGLARSKRVDEALEIFKSMFVTKACIDAVLLSTILGVCAEGRDLGRSYEVVGRIVHGLSLKLGFQNDPHLSNSLLDMYAKNGDMKSAEVTFQNLPKPNTVSWNIMIGGYGRKGLCGKALELMQRMEFLGHQPDKVTFINILMACVNSRNLLLGRQVFNKMACPSLSSWNAMLSGYSQVGNHDEAITLFREMQFRNIKPDRTTLATVLGSCVEIGLLEYGKQVHAVSLKEVMSDNMYIGSGLVTLYSKIGKMDIAKSIFFRLPEVDIVCWNSILAGCSHNSLEGEAFEFFNIMRRRDVSPSEFSYATMLSCCAKQSFSSQGGQIHAQTVKAGFIFDLFVGSALINMYCKCGDVAGAQEVFDAVPVKNAIIWNEIIHGYAQNGLGDKAIRLFNCMITKGEKPDDVTFTAVLTACSYSGFVDEAIRIFESMEKGHEVKPLIDHYTCIIDALGRAGRLHEAEWVIEKMACKNDLVIWEVLLSSCRVYGDVLIAKQAAEKLLSLNPGCSTPYVLLANVYSSLGRWEEARGVRELMTDRNVGKNTGFSWADTKYGSSESEFHCSYV